MTYLAVNLISYTNAMFTLKISDELEKKLGVKTSEEALALLDKEAASSQAAAADFNGLRIKVETLQTGFAAIQATCTELQAKISAIPKALDESSIVAKAEAAAKIVASGEVSAAIAKSGGAAIASKETPPANPGTASVAGDDFEAQFKASKELQDEFSSASTYAAYAKALKGGRIVNFDESKRN